MQILTVDGRLGKDATIRETSTGSRFIALTLANNEKRSGVEKTYWYDVTSYDVDRYKNMVQYLTKGSYVIVSGNFESSLQTDANNVIHERLAIRNANIGFGNVGQSGATQTNASVVAENTASNASADASADIPDEIPMQSKKTASKSKKAEPTPVEKPSDDLPF